MHCQFQGSIHNINDDAWNLPIIIFIPQYRRLFPQLSPVQVLTHGNSSWTRVLMMGDSQMRNTLNALLQEVMID